MIIYIYLIIETRKISRRVEEGISVQNKYVESVSGGTKDKVKEWNTGMMDNCLR